MTTWFGGTGGATDSAIGSDTVIGQSFAAPVSGNITQARAWLGTDNANTSITVAVYANSGGVPGALLGQSDPLALTHPAAVSLRTLTFSTPVTVVSGTSYFLTTWSPTNNHKLRRDPGVGTTYYRTSVSSLPNPFGTASSFGGYQPNLEAGIDPAAVTPVADFTGTPLSGAAPLSVAFTDTSTNSPTSWAWTFGDTGTSSSQNPSHSYTASGVYTVALVATNTAGSDTETKTGYVVVDVTVEAIKIKTSADWIELATGGGGAPTGTAGGVLDGTYPNPGLNASVAGAGLSEASDVLAVNVDGSTLEIASDTVRVKDAGITSAKLGSIPLDTLSDVSVSSPADGDVLTWDAGASGWVRKSTATLVEKVLQLKIIDDATTLTTGDGKLIFACDDSMNGRNLIDADAYVTTVSSSGLPTVQIRNVTDSVDMLTTKISIDASEFTSYTAAAAPVIDTSHDDVATGDLLAVDVDVAGTGAKGLGVILTFS